MNKHALFVSQTVVLVRRDGIQAQLFRGRQHTVRVKFNLLQGNRQGPAHAYRTMPRAIMTSPVAIPANADCANRELSRRRKCCGSSGIRHVVKKPDNCARFICMLRVLCWQPVSIAHHRACCRFPGVRGLFSELCIESTRIIIMKTVEIQCCRSVFEARGLAVAAERRSSTPSVLQQRHSLHI